MLKQPGVSAATVVAQVCRPIVQRRAPLCGRAAPVSGQAEASSNRQALLSETRYDARSNATGAPTNGWMIALNPASKDSMIFDATGRPDRLTTWRAGQQFKYTWVYDQLVTGPQQLTVRYPSGDSTTAYVSYENQFRLAGLMPDKPQGSSLFRLVWQPLRSNPARLT